jgi:hypothetical protein
VIVGRRKKGFVAKHFPMVSTNERGARERWKRAPPHTHADHGPVARRDFSECATAWRRSLDHVTASSIGRSHHP